MMHMCSEDAVAYGVLHLWMVCRHACSQCLNIDCCVLASLWYQSPLIMQHRLGYLHCSN